MRIEDQIFEARDLGDPNLFPNVGLSTRLEPSFSRPTLAEVMGLFPHTESIHPQNHIDPLSVYYSIPFQAFLPMTAVCPP